jgi:hypothetical protein
MREERLPDCRPCRRDLSVTYASSHPELISGDFAMRPHVPVYLTSAERESVAKWSWGFAIAAIVIMVMIMAWPALNSGGQTRLVASDEATSSFAQFQAP